MESERGIFNVNTLQARHFLSRVQLFPDGVTLLDRFLETPI